MIFFDFHHHNPNNRFGIYNLNFREEIPDFSFSAGIHPKDIDGEIDEKMNWLREISKHPNCVAIGECGLDGLISVDEKMQQEIFEKQIELANILQKPLIIHCVKRFSELLHFEKKSKVPMIVHGFNKKETIGEDLLKHGFYLSFGKSVLQNVPLQQFLGKIPLEKILIESDNAGIPVEEIYLKISEIKKLNIEDLNQKIQENLQNLKIPV